MSVRSVLARSGIAMLAAGSLAVTACGRPARTPDAEASRSAPAPRASARAWVTMLDRDHPLVGRIWSVRERRFVDERDMIGALHAGPDGGRALGVYVLLGEKHDNPDHHALQAEVLRALVERGAKPVVAFEMFDVEKQAAIDEARRTSPRDATALARAVDWEHSGWPAWSHYAPIAQVALDADLPIIAGGLSATKMRAMMRPPAEGAGPVLDEGVPLTPDQRASLTEELRASHCGHLPEAMLPVMIKMQRARDAAMANALVTGVDRAHPSGVLIAGTGHTRTDRGVPLDLRARDPGRPVWSIAFVEVERGKDDADAYAPRWNTTKLPFDFVWFTPRATDEDPCAAFAH